MTRSVNKIIIIGSLLQDPQVLTQSGGQKLCQFKMLTTPAWKSRSSSKDYPLMDFHNIVIHSPRFIALAQDHARKGTTLYLEGQMEHSRQQDESGNEQRVTEIALRQNRSRMVILD